MVWDDKPIGLNAATLAFREAIAHAERMETQTQFAWDAVARARLRLTKARQRNALPKKQKPKRKKWELYT